MIGDSSLNLVYSFEADGSPKNKKKSGQYRIAHFFSEMGYVPLKVNQKVYSTLYPKGQEVFVGFGSLQELEIFAQEICQEMDHSEVFLLSNHDYNAALDTINHLNDFHSMFKKFGKSLKNPKFKAGSSGIMNKIFS